MPTELDHVDFMSIIDAMPWEVDITYYTDRTDYDTDEEYEKAIQAGG